jgi:hypothetical protein
LKKKAGRIAEYQLNYINNFIYLYTFIEV